MTNGHFFHLVKPLFRQEMTDIEAQKSIKVFYFTLEIIEAPLTLDWDAWMSHCWLCSRTYYAASNKGRQRLPPRPLRRSKSRDNTWLPRVRAYLKGSREHPELAFDKGWTCTSCNSNTWVRSWRNRADYCCCNYTLGSADSDWAPFDNVEQRDRRERGASKYIRLKEIIGAK